MQIIPNQAPRRTRQDLGTAIYRLAARVCGQILGTSEIVESVYVRRSVATGEVSFGRSDIDLSIVVRQPMSNSRDGSELWALSRKLWLLRIANPALGETEVHDPLGLERWKRADTYRGSLDRRSALFVYGKPAETPGLPVLQEHAVRRLAFWPHEYLTTALRQQNRRNLKKLALEMWNAYATATGMIREPFQTRRETEAFWRRAGEGATVDRLASDPGRAYAFALESGERLHDELLPPLEKISRPIIFRATVPPLFVERTFVVLPRPDSPLPPEVFHPSSLVLTPELLDLYLHYVNPFLQWVLTRELSELGICPPSVASFARSCRYHVRGPGLRSPGFIDRRTAGPGRRLAVVRHAAWQIARGEIPGPMDPGELRQMTNTDPPSLREYYESVFPRLYRECEEIWGLLEGAPDSTR